MSKPAKTYTPQAGGLPARVCAYFQANPSEELTVIDIAYKFNVSSQGVQACLNAAVDAHLLVRLRNADLELVYGPGKAINTLELPASQDLTPTAPAPIWPTAAPLTAGKPLPKPTAKAPNTMVVLPSLDAIQIDDDVPLPAILHRPDAKVRVATLTALLGKLQPNQSAPLPIGVYATLNKVVAATHKTGAARYATRKDKAAQTLRVWRVS